jgi:hypothetical protein
MQTLAPVQVDLEQDQLELLQTLPVRPSELESEQDLCTFISWFPGSCVISCTDYGSICIRSIPIIIFSSPAC